MSLPEESKYYTVGSIHKAFHVIEVMSYKASWELGELAKAVVLPKGTLQRILLTLEEIGYVSRKKWGGAYSLTLKMLKIGQRISSCNPLVELARPICRRLMERVNETVNLCIGVGMDMVVISQEVSWQALRLDSIIGSSFAIYPSASGKVYCAFSEDQSFLFFLNELRKERPELTAEDIDRFCADLRIVKKEGIGLDWEEIFVGVRCAAAPIFDFSGKLAATIGCSVPSVRINEETSNLLITEISKAAANISQALGAPARDFLPVTRTMVRGPIK